MLTPENLKAAACIEWLAGMSASDKWNLTEEEVATLLGGPAYIFTELKNKLLLDQPIELSVDMLERISLLLGISKALQTVAPVNRNDLVYAWFSQPNTGSRFNGQSIKEYLLCAESIESFYAARDYLMAYCEP